MGLSILLSFLYINKRTEITQFNLVDDEELLLRAVKSKMFSLIKITFYF